LATHIFWLIKQDGYNLGLLGSKKRTIIKDDVVLAENGSFSSQRLARLESNQRVTASSSFNENGSSGHSMISYNTNAKFTLKDNESVRWTTIGQTEHSHGGFSSESRGNVDTDGTMVATVKTETVDLSESVTLGASFSSGAAIEDKLGGYFISSIIVVNASGGDSSYSQESSTISISQVHDHGSQQQTVTSISSSSDRFTYSLLHRDRVDSRANLERSRNSFCQLYAFAM